MMALMVSDQDVTAWFNQWIGAFMIGDVQKAIVGTQNFGAALMLLCYTEVLGAISKGLLGIRGNERDNFKAGLSLLDGAALAESATNGPTYYSGFAIQRKSPTPGSSFQQSSLYDVLRCGMVHEYWAKGTVQVSNNPADPTGMGCLGTNGVAWAPGTPVLVFNVNAYSRHFQAGAVALYSAIIADKASTGARQLFEKSINNVAHEISP